MLLDCGLHDMKGEAKANHRLIYKRQSSKALKEAIVKGMVTLGQGPFKSAMCGRDWRKVIASEIVYARCTPEEQELQLTLSIMTDTGLYKPPEEWCNQSIVAYSLHATWYAVQKEALFGTGEDGKPLPSTTKVAGSTLAGVFGRHYKAVARTNILTNRLEPPREGSTECEEETYCEVKHHIDVAFCPSSIEDSMLSGINKGAGMVATSKALRRTSNPTGKVEGTIRKLHNDTLSKRGYTDYGKVYRPSKKMLLSPDFGIWLLLFPDLWIRSPELGLTATSIIRELPGDEHWYEGGVDGLGGVRAIEIDLLRADDVGVMARFTSWSDNRESLMQYLIDKILRPHFLDEASAFVPSWGAARGSVTVDTERAPSADAVGSSCGSK
jgi:hypothetical protein